MRGAPKEFDNAIAGALQRLEADNRCGNCGERGHFDCTPDRSNDIEAVRRCLQSLREEYAEDVGRLETELGAAHATIARLHAEAAARDATSEFHPADTEWFCPQCGLGVRTDEDGCCATCGATLCTSDELIAMLEGAGLFVGAEQGLHLVTAADKAVLDALDATSLGDLQFLPGLDGSLDHVYDAELARRGLS